MTRTQLRQRIAAWVALAALAGNAFAPLLAHAKPGAALATSEICSATGATHLGNEAPEGDLLPSHCALCPCSGDRMPIGVPDGAPALPTCAALEARPAPPAAGLPASPLDLSARPRAPPFFS